ncbi:TolB family protein [Bacteroides sp. UBA939]|uniref:TolB family protein n=1 Tax=Bacteroides sp. UBA939 TaxID=1946092 RepID=UPI0025BBBA72|nr:hypothetical protein [Bacteroides sp. UBA939]
MKVYLYIFILLSQVLTACNSKPETYMQVSQQPVLFPDYTGIIIPCNVAPMNFQLQDSLATACFVLIEGYDCYSFSSSSTSMKFPAKEWKAMLNAEKGNTLRVSIHAKRKHENVVYERFTWTVASEPIDRYLSYRLIEPAYEVWNRIQICERDIESFDERILGDNNITENACMNCHTANRGEVQTTFMHVRGARGGTIYADANGMRKINTKTAQTTGPAVYGELSSDGRYGIFTTAEIIPSLHSLRGKRLEVYDKYSDLILIDFERGTVSDNPAVSGESYQETFPCFSADNQTIYFCRAKYLSQPDSTMQMHYDLYSVAFNPETGVLGDSVHKVFDAAAQGKSVSFPKCSPDGKYLLFAVSDYGTFPIWHPETDLWMLNLCDNTLNKLPLTNSYFSDSYHSWSSNSRWFVFASKRSDGLYGRPYFAYVDDKGNASKAFVLPQKDPECYRKSLKSYNIPEVYKYKEKYDAHKMEKIYFEKETEQFIYE